MKTLKHLVRDLIILKISLSGTAYLYRRRIRRRGPLVRVLCFHDVPEEKWFDSVVQMLSQKYNPLTPEQFHQKQFAEDKINILLTFDDGYQSWLDVALPVLEKYHVKAIFFISSGLLDAKEEGYEAAAQFVYQRLHLRRPRLVLTWEGTKQIRNAGHTIGGHTHTHANLGKLNATKVEEEVLKNKRRLEDKLHVELKDFAYPFGRTKHMSPIATDIIKTSGYPYVYSATTGFTTEANAGEEIPRTVVEKKQSLPSLKRWIGGGYDMFNKIMIR